MFWLAEPVILFALSFGIVGLIIRIAIESPNAADRTAAWIVVAIMIPSLYLLWRIEYRRFQRHFRG